LAEFVAAGGTLISECRPGYVNELGWLYERQPGAGLDEVFGAQEDYFWNTASVTAHLHGFRERSRLVFPTLCQSYRVGSGSVLAKNDKGEAIAVSNAYAQGRAILFGFAPSLLFRAPGGKYQAASGGATERENERGAIEMIGRPSKRPCKTQGSRM
jgi:hypothetical protein